MSSRESDEANEEREEGVKMNAIRVELSACKDFIGILKPITL